MPIRFTLVELFGESLLSSIGIISVISIVIFILAIKNKLGWFGKMLIRQIIRLTTGKRRFFVLFILSIAILYLTFSVYTINLGNTVYAEEKLIDQAKVDQAYDLDFENPEQILETINPNDIIDGIPEYFTAIFTNIKDIAIANAIVNDKSNGIILTLHTVILVEELELLGLFIFFSIVVQKNPEKYKKLLEEQPAQTSKQKKTRLKLILLGIAIFSVSYQIGSMIEMSQQDSELLLQEIKVIAQDMDGLKIFWHNIQVALIMFVPAFGAFWGSLTGFQTGMAFAALQQSNALFSQIPAISLLFLSPIGIIEIIAYGIAISRSIILIKHIRHLKQQIKPTLKEICIVVGLLLFGGFLEFYLIEWVSDMGYSLEQMI